MDEREFIAAERALGHEPATGETPEDAARREAWERRLAPLLTRIAPAAPPPSLLPRIEREIDALIGPALSARGDAGFVSEARAGAGSAEIVELEPLRRRVRRWKSIAAVATAAAAALALYIAAPALIAPPAGEAARYVAVVTADDGGQAGLIIQIDTGTGLATVIPVTAPPAGASYEMWTIPAGETRPVSLGLLPQAAVMRRELDVTDGQLFAISLEPEGGSPTGQPTQPIYHGRVVKVE